MVDLLSSSPIVVWMVREQTNRTRAGEGEAYAARQAGGSMSCATRKFEAFY
jgi:hypothetical protein